MPSICSSRTRTRLEKPVVTKKHAKDGCTRTEDFQAEEVERIDRRFADAAVTEAAGSEDDPPAGEGYWRRASPVPNQARGDRRKSGPNLPPKSPAAAKRAPWPDG